MLSGYRPGAGYDELLDSALMPRTAALPLFEHLAHLDVEELYARQELAQLTIESAGISFTVYSEGTGIDRAWPSMMRGTMSNGQARSIPVPSE